MMSISCCGRVELVVTVRASVASYADETVVLSDDVNEWTGSVLRPFWASIIFDPIDELMQFIDCADVRHSAGYLSLPGVKGDGFLRRRASWRASRVAGIASSTWFSWWRRGRTAEVKIYV